jgi:hypothetical protein
MDNSNDEIKKLKISQEAINILDKLNSVKIKTDEEYLIRELIKRKILFFEISKQLENEMADVKKIISNKK